MLSLKARSGLRRIRSEVSEGRWIKGQGSDGQGNFCLSGWIGQVGQGDQEALGQMHSSIMHQIRKRDGRFESIPAFNDSHRTTKDHVIEVIDAVLSEGMEGAANDDVR